MWRFTSYLREPKHNYTLYTFDIKTWEWLRISLRCTNSAISTLKVDRRDSKNFVAFETFLFSHKKINWQRQSKEAGKKKERKWERKFAYNVILGQQRRSFNRVLFLFGEYSFFIIVVVVVEYQSINCFHLKSLVLIGFYDIANAETAFFSAHTFPKHSRELTTLFKWIAQRIVFQRTVSVGG